jgi:cell division septal protein FtsQ
VTNNFHCIYPEAIERGMVIGGRIITGTTYIEQSDTYRLNTPGSGRPVEVPANEPLILVEDEGPWQMIVRGWPTHPSALAEAQYENYHTTTRKKDKWDMTINDILRYKSRSKARMDS